jgi:NADH:ubiquinone oxidoreductase subunit 6 (subunit J)
MTGGTILFWLLAAGACLGAIAVVLSQNVVRMAFWLIVSLGSTAGLFFLLHADFVAATQLLVYVGGTVVLLIFGVMLTASGPYNQLKMSPGNLIAVAATGAAVFFISFMSVKAVDWDRSVLRQVVLSEDKYDEVHHAITDEKTDHLLHEAFHSVDVNGTEVYHYAPKEELKPDEQRVLLDLLKQNGLTFSPSSETGGTIRPLGFGLLGSRPDKDLNSPAGLQKLSVGFYVVRPAAESHAANEAEEPHPAISTGYLLPFEIASIHLLVVLIGAAYLARAKRRVETSL